jgi:cation:H+ antiporter
MLLDVLLLIIGFVLLTRGADYFVDGSSALAGKLRIPPIIIGLTVVAMGTSAPEAFISIISAIHNSNSIAIGNVIGSNIANIFLILGITSIIYPLTVQKNTLTYEMPFVAFITILLCWMGMKFGMISRGCAIVLLGLFIMFLMYLYIMSKKNKDQDIEIKQISGLKISLYVFGGLIALVLGSNLTVDSAVNIARYVGVSERVIGLTIIAFGTSVPELVTCVIAALKKQSDIAIGNIIGSNIFNILFVLGIAGVILPIPFNSAFMFDGFLALMAIIMLMLFTCKNRRLGRFGGIIFVIIYALYIAFLVIGK